jgi:hypothetical protein
MTDGSGYPWRQALPAIVSRFRRRALPLLIHFHRRSIHRVSLTLVSVGASVLFPEKIGIIRRISLLLGYFSWLTRRLVGGWNEGRQMFFRENYGGQGASLNICIHAWLLHT